MAHAAGALDLNPFGFESLADQNPKAGESENIPRNSKAYDQLLIR